MSVVARVGWALIFSLASLACGSSGSSGSSASGLEGLWAASSLSGTNSCSGEYQLDEYDFTMRLRAGTMSDLEYVSLDPKDLSRETCVQEFSVMGNVATMTGTQECTYDGVVLTYLEDRVEVAGDSLHEIGQSQSPDFESPGSLCTDDFEIDFTRVK